MESTSNLPSRFHVSMVFGGSQMGKDTLIYNFDRSLLNFMNSKGENVIKFGDLTSSCTKDFTAIPYQNSNLISNFDGIMLNTIGLGDSQGNSEDLQIASRLLDWCLRNQFDFIIEEIEKVY